MIQDLKEFHHLAKMASQLLIKEFLQVVKKMIIAPHGLFKLIRLLMIKVKNK